MRYFCDMKFWAFIMAILVFVLSCMPCTDAVFAMNAGKVRTEITKAPVQQHDYTDSCSPFCQCTCCAGFTFNGSFYSLTIPVNFTSSSYTVYSKRDIVEISLPIWQPPQL